MPSVKKEYEKKFARLRFYALILIFIFLVITSLILHAKGLNFKQLKNISASVYAPFIYIAVFVFFSFFPLPFTPITLVGAKIFTFYEAVIYSLAGNIIFATVMFYITRILGRDYVEQWENKNRKIKELDVKFKKNALRDIFLLRLFFIVPTEAVNVISGLSRVKFKNFIMASTLGFIPVLIAWVAAVKTIHNPFLFFLSILANLLLLIIPVFYMYNLRCFVENNYGRACFWRRKKVNRKASQK